MNRNRCNEWLEGDGTRTGGGGRSNNWNGWNGTDVLPWLKPGEGLNTSTLRVKKRGGVVVLSPMAE